MQEEAGQPPSVFTANHNMPPYHGSVGGPTSLRDQVYKKTVANAIYVLLSCIFFKDLFSILILCVKCSSKGFHSNPWFYSLQRFVRERLLQALKMLTL